MSFFFFEAKPLLLPWNSSTSPVPSMQDELLFLDLT
uniref:Uncharacterized protein n=1 Tax=Manihot esculenta TaxID=3983 RepID=A0A2C9VQU0_MANES